MEVRKSALAADGEDQRDPDRGADYEQDGAEFEDIGSAAEKQDAAEERAEQGRGCC